LRFDMQKLFCNCRTGRADDILHRDRWRRPFCGAECGDENTTCTSGDVGLIDWCRVGASISGFLLGF
jgi:hypothetical protein